MAELKLESTESALVLMELSSDSAEVLTDSRAELTTEETEAALEAMDEIAAVSVGSMLVVSTTVVVSWAATRAAKPARIGAKRMLAVVKGW